MALYTRCQIGLVNALAQLKAYQRPDPMEMAFGKATTVSQLTIGEHLRQQVSNDLVHFDPIHDEPLLRARVITTFIAAIHPGRDCECASSIPSDGAEAM